MLLFIFWLNILQNFIYIVIIIIIALYITIAFLALLFIVFSPSLVSFSLLEEVRLLIIYLALLLFTLIS